MMRLISATILLSLLLGEAPGSVDRLRFAMCSCTSLAHGWLHVFQRIAERNDVGTLMRPLSSRFMFVSRKATSTVPPPKS